MKVKLIPTLVMTLLMTFSITGCQQTIDPAVLETLEGLITLSKNSIQTELDTVEISGSKLTISTPGTYTLTGKLDNGQVIVDTLDTVVLVLYNADITCRDSAAIHVKEAGEFILELADGTKNTITDGSNYANADMVDAPTAAIYSKADFIIRGSGKLNVTGKFADGIVSKDTLQIDGGDISVLANATGFEGKDKFIMNGGSLKINSQDGIKSTNDIDEPFGYVELNGGNIDISAKDDAIAAISKVVVNGGNITIQSINNGIVSDDLIDLQGGKINITAIDDDFVCLNHRNSDTVELIVNGQSVLPQ